jgi:hypothetical protein
LVSALVSISEHGSWPFRHLEMSVAGETTAGTCGNPSWGMGLHMNIECKDIPLHKEQGTVALNSTHAYHGHQIRDE